MASRSFHQGPQALDIDTVVLFASATIGASGAVTSSTAGVNGIATIVRTSVGRYTVTLQDAYVGFRWADVALLSSTAPSVILDGVLSRVVSQDVASAKTVVFELMNVTGAGAAADPASGSVLYFNIVLKNSSV